MISEPAQGDEAQLDGGWAGQAWSAEGYARNARFVSDLGEAVLSWLDPKPGERILDLGCGDGALTARIAASGAEIVGVDASEDMVAAARERGLDAQVVDGRALSVDAEFDAVFSNAALHWMGQADDVIAGVTRALKPGGRFVAEFGGHGNVAAICTALLAVAREHGLDDRLAHPWYFPTAESYAARLQSHGLAIRRIVLRPRPTPLPTGIEGWLETFRRPLFDALPDTVRQEALHRAVSLLAPSLRDEEGRWTADYVRLRVDAVRPS